MLLAGTGQVSDKGTKNFLIVDNSAWADEWGRRLGRVAH